MYKIKWKSLITGSKGEGKPTNEIIAKAWCEYENKKHPNIFHWIVKI